ncbi:MAG: BamA/TamA family outer membrane protein [Polyangiaceae bacterium]
MPIRCCSVARGILGFRCSGTGICAPLQVSSDRVGRCTEFCLTTSKSTVRSLTSELSTRTWGQLSFRIRSSSRRSTSGTIRVSPHKGAYVSMNTQIAGVGGDAKDVKLQPEARVYVPLTKRLTLATRATIGLLFPSNYGDTVQRNALSGMPSDAERAEWIRDIQLMFLRGFFSGGAGSNRGYALREIGPHGDVPFYNPSQTPLALAETCRSDNPDRPSSVCDLPLGGFTLWEASIELRFPVTGPLSGALFSDTSDVAAQRAKFRFDCLHLSVGLGLRYETPVGPIRLDVGYRIPGLQSPSSPDEGRPATLVGLPMAVSFGIWGGILMRSESRRPRATRKWDGSDTYFGSRLQS